MKHDITWLLTLISLFVQKERAKMGYFVSLKSIAVVKLKGIIEDFKNFMMFSTWTTAEPTCTYRDLDFLIPMIYWPLKASSVLFAVGQVNCLLGLGTNTGLVVDVGYNETIVLPVSISNDDSHHMIFHSIKAASSSDVPKIHDSCLSLQVYEGIPVLKALQSVPLGGKAIHK